MKRRIVSILLAVGIMTGLFAVNAFADSTAKVYTGDKSEIDATHQNDAYVKVRYLSATDKKLKVTIQMGESKYTYDLSSSGATEIYSLQMGSGQYTVKVLERISAEENKYSVVQTAVLDVAYTSEFAPYLIPVQNINYTTASPAIAKAKELAQTCSADLDKVNAIYSYIVNTVTYDKDLASKISSGTVTTYLPNVDNVYLTSKGICYDYSSLMAAMCRSIGIPAKLITGYVGSDQLYHAWNEVYISGSGWITVKSSVFFPGDSFERMDSTFAAGNNSGGLNDFIGDGSNYIKKYEY